MGGPILWPHRQTTPFLFSILQPPYPTVRLPGRKGDFGVPRKVDSNVFVKLRRVSWARVGLGVGLEIGLA